MLKGDRVRQVKTYTVFPTRGFTPSDCIGRRGTVLAFTPQSILDASSRTWPPVAAVKWDGVDGFDQRIPADALEVLNPVDRLAELDRASE